MTILLIEIAVIFLLLLANGVFAMTEIAIVSSRRALLEARAAKGSPGAARALALVENPNRFLSTVQFGITLIGIVAGAFGGAGIAERLAEYLAPVPGIGDYANGISFTLVIGAITYGSLVIGELVPKRLAMRFPETIACRMAGMMSTLSKLAAPFTSLLAVSTEYLLKLCGVREQEDDRMSREELFMLLRAGAGTGDLDPSATRMLEGALNFGDLDVCDIMIPRPKMTWIECDARHAGVWKSIAGSNEDFFPVYRQRKDNLVGVISVKECYAQLARGAEIRFGDLMKPPLIVPEIQQASALLDTFRKTGHRVAFVMNEFGVIIGMVTLTDLMEAIIGDVPSSQEQLSQPVTAREDGTYLVDGMLTLSALETHLPGFKLPTEEDPRTLAALFSQTLARIPRLGDTWEHGEWRFEVIDMDGMRVDKLLASPIHRAGEQTGSPPADAI
jgi:putative hemolysin